MMSSSGTPTTIEQIAGWVHSVRPEHIPASVKFKARMQIASVLSASMAGSRTSDGRAVTQAVHRWSSGTKGWLFGSSDPSPESISPLDALYVHAAWSMAQDYDDYMFMGHTGHSAVWAPIVVAMSEKDFSLEQWICAVIIGNEIAGRVGAAALLGPANGQLWSFIHRPAAAAAVAYLLGLDAKAIAHAIALSLYQPNSALYPGFMGPGSKLITASEPAIAGVQAAYLAQAGVTGALGLLDDEPKTFLRRFSFVPLHGMLTGWGRSWVTETLAIKPYPGCAYIDTTIDAVRKIQQQYLAERGSSLSASQIESIIVRASVLTIEMNHLAGDVSNAIEVDPVAVNFHIPMSVALVLHHGRLTGAEVDRETLRQHQSALQSIAQRVTLQHSAAMTYELLKEIDSTLPIRNILGSVGLGDLVRAGKMAERELGRAGGFGGIGRDMAGRLTARQRGKLWHIAVKPALKKIFDPLTGFPPSPLDLSDTDFAGWRMPFGSSVEIQLTGGGVMRADQLHPRGVSWREDFVEVVREKWFREIGQERQDRGVEEDWNTLATGSIDAVGAWLRRCAP